MKLKETLDAAVAAASDPNPDAARAALELLAKNIKETTSTMTAVPKPLKFLTPHYSGLVAAYQVRGCPPLPQLRCGAVSTIVCYRCGGAPLLRRAWRLRTRCCLRTCCRCWAWLPARRARGTA